MKPLVLLLATLCIPGQLSSPTIEPIIGWQRLLINAIFFLRPHRMLSLRLRNLDAGAWGLLPDLLSEFTFQPALLSTFAGNTFYVDLKGSSNRQMPFKFRVYTLYDSVNSYFIPLISDGR